MILAFSLFFPQIPLTVEKKGNTSALCYHNGQDHPRQGVFLEAELKLAKKLIIPSSLWKSWPFSQPKYSLGEETMSSGNSVIHSFQNPKWAMTVMRRNYVFHCHKNTVPTWNGGKCCLTSVGASTGVETLVIIKRMQQKAAVRGGNTYFRASAYLILTWSPDSVCMICSTEVQVTIVDSQCGPTNYIFVIPQMFLLCRPWWPSSLRRERLIICWQHREAQLLHHFATTNVVYTWADHCAIVWSKSWGRVFLHSGQT